MAQEIIQRKKAPETALSDPYLVDMPGNSQIGIPFSVEELSGSRPVITGHMNGTRYRFEVHSNAGLYLQTNHHHATIAKIDKRRHVGTYGIVASGELSDLGRDEGVLSLLEIGHLTWKNVPASVFETTDAATTGMLGLKWIEATGLVMDFPTRMLRVTAGQREALPRSLSFPAKGYTPVQMRRDESTGRFLVDVTINEATRPMVVSTVSCLVLDTEFAAVAKVGTGTACGSGGGPTGMVVARHSFEQPVQLTIGEWTSRPMEGEIEDTYGYSGAGRPATGATGGYLGADFLIANQAVVDFGRRCLYLSLNL